MRARDSTRSFTVEPNLAPAEPSLLPEGFSADAPGPIARALEPTFASIEVEEFHLITVGVRLRVLRTTLIARGSLSAVHVHPRDVFVPAVRERAAAVIVCHNHPSQDPEPSHEDLQLTRRLFLAAEVIGIALLDHIILGGPGRYVSLAERGEIPRRTSPDDGVAA